jgi:hypothetical protein
LLRTKWFFPEDGTEQLEVSVNGSRIDRNTAEATQEGDELLQVMETDLPVKAERPDRAGDTPHPDESQVLLDTKRSFVVYPKGELPKYAADDI